MVQFLFNTCSIPVERVLNVNNGEVRIVKDSLSKEMQEIKELIGSDAFLKLIYAFGGSTVVFPTIRTVKYLE